MDRTIKELIALKYYESPAFAKWCERVYGSDMKQQGMLTKAELDLFFREVKLQPNSNILDIGCGAGYISSYISDYYKSKVTGIDIDVGAIEHAKATFSGNTALNFCVLDGNEIAYEEQSFDLICFIDTLYFTSTIEKLRLLLEKSYKMLKPHGKLVVFWANYPNELYNVFEMSMPAANNTQVGKWGVENRLQFKSFDLTAAYRAYWLKALEETKAMEAELNEEIPEHFKTLLSECNYFAELCKKGNAGKVYRWLYVFEKK